MKPTAAILACTLVAALPVGAQNLVPNPSFEDHTLCPSNFSQIERAIGWMSFRVTPDYFNECSPNDSAGVPLNYFGYQEAATGHGYAGITCYTAGNPVNGREYMGIALDQPVLIGQPLYLSFKTVFASSGVANFYRFQYNCTGIGMRFSMNPFMNGLGWPVPNNAALHLDQLITDSIGWTNVSGVYTADSAYQYLVIGNFFDDQSIAIDQFDPNGNQEWAYFYVDDVCVSPNPNDCATAEGIEDPHTNTLLLHPNPAEDHVMLTSTKLGSTFASVVLLDASGRAVPVQVERNTAQQLTLRWAQPLAPGVYLLRAALRSGERFTERVVVQ